MEGDNVTGCISCLNKNGLCDLFVKSDENSYAKMFERCFGVKVSNDLKSICVLCAQILKDAYNLKEQTVKNISALHCLKDEEYLDETILAEADFFVDNEGYRENVNGTLKEDENDIDKKYLVNPANSISCIYCSAQMTTQDELSMHINTFHGMESTIGQQLQECHLCGVVLHDTPAEHYNKCHTSNSEMELQTYPCHFCDSVYNSRKACFTHLRMKHGLKLISDQTPKFVPRERKKCDVCNRDFSQKQILNKHLLKAHGIEVEKRKAFFCPLCDERVSYGVQFSIHLQVKHQVVEEVEKLEFQKLDDFILYKSAIQEETKYRFRKTTASKQTIEGLRSHFMCSQSGVYIYQGKGKRAAPERQIYKTGKACPAHMIVTETVDRVLVTFHKTHVGHGVCPYYEPREAKKHSLTITEAEMKCEKDEPDCSSSLTWICDSCGMSFLDVRLFKSHVNEHKLNDRVYPCHYCPNVFQNLEFWTNHQAMEHGVLY